MKITESELFDALAAATPAAPADAMTGPELQQLTRVGDKKLRAALRLLDAQGRLQVHRVVRRRINGSPCIVSAYTILPSKKKK